MDMMLRMIARARVAALLAAVGFGVAAAGIVIPSGQGNCGLQLGGAAAFCATFDQLSPVNSRAGQLDSVVWGVSRVGGDTNFGQGQSNMWAATLLERCDGTTSPRVNPPNDVIICNGQLREASNDNTSGQLDQGGVTALTMYPKQPFDFAGRTGTVSFDVSNDTHGNHAAWPEFWMTDLPVPGPFVHISSFISNPRHGFGVRFGAGAEPGQFGLCPNANNIGQPRWTADSAVIVRNYAAEDSFTNPQGMTFTITDCVISSPAVGQMNHVEVRVSQGQVEVWASDAGQTALRRIAVIGNASLSFTRGLVWLEDAHYNADKGGLPSQREHTFAWDNIAFDGPFTYRDLSFDAPDALAPGTNGAVHLGKTTGAGQASSWSVPGLPASPTAAAVRVLFNFFHYTPPASLTVTVNGHPHPTPWPYPDMQSLTWRTLAVTIPIADLVAGTNTVLLGSPDQTVAVANVNIVLVDASGTPPPPPPPIPSAVIATAGTPQATPVNTAFPAALQATVRDQNSNPMAGVTVTFQAPTSGARATFGGSSSATAVTNAGGGATAPTLTANGTAGSYTVTARVAGVAAPATYSLQNTPNVCENVVRLNGQVLYVTAGASACVGAHP